jgi:hypothetical protein
LKVSHFPSILAVIALAALTAACDNDANPNDPSEFNTVPATAELGAPTPDSPADGAQLDTLRPTLTVNNGTSNAPGNLPRTYEFQIADTPTFEASAASFITAYRVILTQGNIPEGANGKTSFTPSTDLQPGALLYWRARMIQIGQASAWSATRSFRTKAAAYNRAGELFDPLVDGQSIGSVIGAVQFIPNVGAKLINNDSRITYNLVETVSQGEFSMIIEGIDEGSESDKGKVFSMQENGGDITTNDYRYTVEYRGRNYGGTPGTVAWRVITGDADEDDGCISDGVRTVVNLTDERAYFWRTSWNPTSADLLIQEGGQGGPTLFSQGIGLNCRPYRPVPHVAHVGAPPGRGSIQDATVAGMIARFVYLGVNPRPAALGTAVR